MATVTIDLEKFRSVDKQTKYKSKVFTGRDRGIDVRDESKIDELEATLAGLKENNKDQALRDENSQLQRRIDELVLHACFIPRI